MNETPRRPRLEDVAAEAGVSTATVSLVLRGVPGPSTATRERVLEVTARLGYRPDRAASALASRRSRSIGVVFDVSNAFHAELVQDIHEAAERHRFDVVLSTTTRHRDLTRATETLLDSRCEGLLLVGPSGTDQHLSALGRQLPLVVVGRPVNSGDVDVVRAADDKGVELEVDHLVGLGHRRIAYVDGGRGAIAGLRRRGYRAAMRRHGLLDQIQVVAGGQTETAGAEAAAAILPETSRPTGVLAFNDRCALGFIDKLVRAGVDVPEQMSVVGYDDSPVARLAHVDLTTVSQNPAELSEHAILALAERLDRGRTKDTEVVVVPRLVVRGTGGPPL